MKSDTLLLMMSLTTMRTVVFATLFLILFFFQVQGYSYATAGLGIATLFIFMVFLVNDSNWRLQLSLPCLSLLALSAWFIANTAMSSIPGLSIITLPPIIFFPLLLFVMAGTQADFINETILWRGLSILGGITACYALYQFYYGAGTWENVANFPFYNPNSLAVFLGVVGLISLYFMSVEKPNSLKILYGVLSLIIIAGIVTTASRAAVIGFGVSGLFLLILMWRTWMVNIYWWLGVVGFIIILPFAMVMTQNDDSASMVIDNITPTSGASASRLAIWEGAVTTAMQERPVMGTGLGTYKQVYLSQKQDRDSSAGLHAHNDILHLWVETGLIGLILLGLFIIGLLWAGLKVKSKDYILPFIVIFFCAGMALVTPIILLPPILMIIALACLPFLRASGGRVLHVPTIIKQTFMLILILCAFISVKNTYEKYLTMEIRGALKNSDFDKMRSLVNNLDTISLGLNPSVPIYRASFMLLLFEIGDIKNDMREAAFDEMQSYIDEAKRRNPYNVENIYYQAMLEDKRGNQNLAKSLWEKALEIDPTYLGARIKLIQNTTDNTRLLQLIEDGLPIKYWKEDPKNFYIIAMTFAKETKNKDLYEKVYRYLQKGMELR